MLAINGTPDVIAQTPEEIAKTALTTFGINANKLIDYKDKVKATDILHNDGNGNITIYRNSATT